MTSEGPNSPSTITNDASAGDVEWTNPGNAASSNDSYATAAVTPTQETNFLKCVGFGFSIPAGATINGVLAEVEGKCGNANGAFFSSSRQRLVKAGTLSGTGATASALFGTTDAYVSIGSSSTLWGTTLTAADVNNANFGVAVRITDNGFTQTISVDHIRITVYYTEAGTPFRRSLLGVGF